MPDHLNQSGFCSINSAFDSVFQANRLSLGIVAPVDNHGMSATPSMEGHFERITRAEELGFAAIWLRDVPFNVPSFGDAGQVFDPFVYLGALASRTERIALGVASVILPLRHPAHVAKAAASVDVLSGGRLLLGVASGDRPDEYPSMNMSHAERGARFRDSMDYIRAMANDYPRFANSHGTLSGGIDMLPKPEGVRLPLLITGGSQQDPAWVASHGDGWMTYPRDLASQAKAVFDYRKRLMAGGLVNKPVMQSLYIDLLPDDNAPPRPIHLGFQSGIGFLREHLRQLQSIGVNHVALNLRFNSDKIETTLERLAGNLLPEFAS